jgi:hypothetical protein
MYRRAPPELGTVEVAVALDDVAVVVVKELALLGEVFEIGDASEVEPSEVLSVVVTTLVAKDDDDEVDGV